MITKNSCWLLAAAMAGLWSRAAQADEVTAAPVHVRVHASTDAEVVLEGEDVAGNGIACTTPCDRRLNLGMRYRINGEGVRPSPYFNLDPGVSAIDVTPGSSTRRTLGIVFTVLSVACIAPGLGLLGAAPSDSGGRTGMIAAGAALLGSSAALGIAGPVLWAGSDPTRVTVLPEGRSARVVALPSLSVSF